MIISFTFIGCICICYNKSNTLILRFISVIIFLYSSLYFYFKFISYNFSIYLNSPLCVFWHLVLNGCVLCPAAWCLRSEGVSSVLLGVSTTDQLLENLGALRVHSLKCWCLSPGIKLIPAAFQHPEQWCRLRLTLFFSPSLLLLLRFYPK